MDDIEDHFNYYWVHDRLDSINTGSYIDDLPRRLKIQVTTGYLFADIFKQFRRFFMVESVHDARFLQEFGFGLMPRKFAPTDIDRIIYDEEEDIPEFYFVIEGVVDIGFRHITG